jgi:hypothetical protein
MSYPPRQYSHTPNPRELRLQLCRSTERNERSETTRPDEVPNKLNLRVLEEYDLDFKVHVARCLETGTLATAETMAEAHNLLMETLRLEVVQASRPGKPMALFEKPAGPIYELRWQALAAEQDPIHEIVTVCDMPVGERKGVKSQLSIRAVKRTAMA